MGGTEGEAEGTVLVGRRELLALALRVPVGNHSPPLLQDKQTFRKFRNGRHQHRALHEGMNRSTVEGKCHHLKGLRLPDYYSPCYPKQAHHSISFSGYET